MRWGDSSCAFLQLARRGVVTRWLHSRVQAVTQRTRTDLRAVTFSPLPVVGAWGANRSQCVNRTASAASLVPRAAAWTHVAGADFCCGVWGLDLVAALGCCAAEQQTGTVV